MNLLRTPVLAALLPLLATTMPSPVLAQGDTATFVSEEDSALARKLLDEGVAAYTKKNYELARDKFRRSFNLKRSYDTATNLGNVEAKLKLYRDAAEHLDYSLRHYPTAENRDRKKSIQRLFETVRPHVGGVTVTIDTPGATIFVDDRPVGTSPLDYELFVEPGKHEVRAEFKDKVASSPFDATKGATSEVTLSLETVESQMTEAIAAPSEEEAAPESAQTAKKNWTPAWILGGATVASFGTSMIFRGLASSTSNQIDELGAGLPDNACNGDMNAATCSQIDDKTQKLKTQSNISNATLIAAGVLGAATIGYVAYVWASSPDEPSVAAHALVSPAGATFSLTGRF